MEWVLKMMFVIPCGFLWVGECLEWREIGRFDTYAACHKEELKHNELRDKTYCKQTYKKESLKP
jgi:hypothetical protein